jgi:hypothetical protein
LSALTANYERLCALFPYIGAACQRESYLEAVGDFARRWAALCGGAAAPTSQADTGCEYASGVPASPHLFSAIATVQLPVLVSTPAALRRDAAFGIAAPKTTSTAVDAAVLNISGRYKPDAGRLRFVSAVSAPITTTLRVSTVTPDSDQPDQTFYRNPGLNLPDSTCRPGWFDQRSTGTQSFAARVPTDSRRPDGLGSPWPDSDQPGQDSDIAYRNPSQALRPPGSPCPLHPSASCEDDDASPGDPLPGTGRPDSHPGQCQPGRDLGASQGQNPLRDVIANSGCGWDRTPASGPPGAAWLPAASIWPWPPGEVSASYSESGGSIAIQDWPDANEFYWQVGPGDGSGEHNVGDV